MARWNIGREFNRRIKQRFDERGIQIPRPQPMVLVQLMPSISLSILWARVRCSYRRPPGAISSLMDW